MARPEAIRPVVSDKAFINLLVFGDPGTGKSSFAGTSPNALMLVHNSDETVSAAIRGSKADKWVIDDYNELTEAYEYMRHEGCAKYEWVWIDNGSLLQERMLDHIMEDLVAAKPHRSQWIPDKPEYLENQNRFSKLLRDFMALPVHFGMTALAMRVEDDDDGGVVYKPLFQGGGDKFSDKVCGYMNVVAHMSARRLEGGAREVKIITDKSGKYYAKDLFNGALGGRMVNPTIPKVVAAIKKVLPTLGSVPAKAGVATKKATPAKKVAAKKVAAAKKTTRR